MYLFTEQVCYIGSYPSPKRKGKQFTYLAWRGYPYRKYVEKEGYRAITSEHF